MAEAGWITLIKKRLDLESERDEASPWHSEICALVAEVELLKTFERGCERAGYKAGRTDELAATEALARELCKKVAIFWTFVNNEEWEWELELIDRKTGRTWLGNGLAGHTYASTQRECMEQALALLDKENEQEDMDTE